MSDLAGRLPNLEIGDEILIGNSIYEFVRIVGINNPRTQLILEWDGFYDTKKNPTCVNCHKPILELTHDGKTYWAHEDSYSYYCEIKTATPS